MDKLTEADESTIRHFLRLCLADGFYAFLIDGSTFILEQESDIDLITTAIKKATPPVIKFRLNQAKREIKKLQAKHPELISA
jgi:hypothetical protein